MVYAVPSHLRNMEQAVDAVDIGSVGKNGVAFLPNKELPDEEHEV